MVKQSLCKRIMVLVVLLTLLLLAACGGGTGNTVTSTATSVNETSTKLQRNYDLPPWWTDDKGNLVDCDKYNYVHNVPSVDATTIKPLAKWHNFEACAPLPILVPKSQPDNFVHFYLGARPEQEFECTELVKRYLYMAYHLPPLDQTNGNQVVDNYTAKYSMWHKVSNKGKVHMTPMEGDVLSYEPNHTAIVTGESMKSPGNGTINVIQQNVALRDGTPVPTETLNVSDWIIQHGTPGSVISWMTMRNIPDVLGASTQVSSNSPPSQTTSTSTPTNTPSSTPSSTRPTLEVSPINLSPSSSACSPGPSDGYNCTVTITETSNSQGQLQWTATTDSWPKFRPSSGTLSPGQSTQISIFFDAATYTLTYKGQANTITGMWLGGSAQTQTLIVSPTSLFVGSTPNCDFANNISNCFVTLTVPSTVSGNIQWSVSSQVSNNVQFNPQSGVLSSGQSMQVHMTLTCETNFLTFTGGNVPVIVTYTCYPTSTPSPPPPPPTPTPTPPPAPVQRTMSSTQTQSSTVNATGQEQTQGTHAKGMLNLFNQNSDKGDITVNAGTVFDADPGTSPNVQMMIDATVIVPGSGSGVTAPAHVVQIGTIGNLSQWRHSDYNGSPQQSLHVDTNTAFTGGTDPQTYTVVQQSDIDGAAEPLKTATAQAATANIQQQLHANEHLVGDPQCSSNVSSNHNAGDKVSQVTVTVATTCTATVST